MDQAGEQLHMNNTSLAGRIARLAVVSGLAMTALWLAGCAGTPVPAERAARRDFEAVSHVFRPDGTPASLPALTNGSGLDQFLLFALLNQPAVAAAYYDWSASIQRITVDRSLPDPKLTFQSDIMGTVRSLMPGLMQDFPGPGKLRAAANIAAAESEAKYFAFESSLLQTALDLKRAYYQLWFLDENVRIHRQSLSLLEDLERIARARNEVGKVTLQDVYRAQLELDQLKTQLENLEDSRGALMARFKGALGLSRDEPDPPPPSILTTTPLELSGDELLATAFARNPRLRALRAEIRMAEGSIAMARKAAVPDFSAGVMADAKTTPVMVRPQLSVSIPLWRDKIAAQVASATAGRNAADARLRSEEILMSVDFAMKAYDYREVTRGLALLETDLVPKARQSLEIARAGYLAGQIDFFNLIDAERTLLNFQLEEVDARTRREVILAELSLSIAGIPPKGAPVLVGTSDPAINEISH